MNISQTIINTKHITKLYADALLFMLKLTSPTCRPCLGVTATLHRPLQKTAVRRNIL